MNLSSLLCNNLNRLPAQTVQPSMPTDALSRNATGPANPANHSFQTNHSLPSSRIVQRKNPEAKEDAAGKELGYMSHFFSPVPSSRTYIAPVPPSSPPPSQDNVSETTPGIPATMSYPDIVHLKENHNNDPDVYDSDNSNDHDELASDITIPDTATTHVVPSQAPPVPSTEAQLPTAQVAPPSAADTNLPSPALPGEVRTQRTNGTTRPTPVVYKTPLGVMYACTYPDCRAWCQEWFNLLRHMKTVHARKEMRDLVAGRITLKEAQMLQYFPLEELRSSEAQVTCPMCGAKFSRSDSRDRHVRGKSCQKK